jgi:serine/threonine protein kinase
LLSIRDIFKGVEAKEEISVYLVTEFFPADLLQIIKFSQTLTERHIQFFMYQIFKGLKYLHSANVLHRDLVRASYSFLCPTNPLILNRNRTTSSLIGTAK